MEIKILLFGATGNTGAHIIKELTAQNLDFKAFVRPDSANRLDQENLQIVKGDVLNTEDLEAAISNDTYTDVIISLGSKALKNSNIRSVGTTNIINAINSGKNRTKLHIISAHGVGESWKNLNWLEKLISNLMLKSVMQDHQKQENAVISSSLPYHIIRPVGLSDGNGTGNVHVQETGSLPASKVDRADVAKYLVDSILQDKTGFSSICK